MAQLSGFQLDLTPFRHARAVMSWPLIGDKKDSLAVWVFRTRSDSQVMADSQAGARPHLQPSQIHFGRPRGPTKMSQKYTYTHLFTQPSKLVLLFDYLKLANLLP